MAKTNGDLKDVKKYPCAKCGVLRSENEGGKIFTVCDECWEKDPPGGRKLHFRCSHCRNGTFDIMFMASARTSLDTEGDVKTLYISLGETPQPKVMSCSRCHFPIPIVKGVKYVMENAK